MLLYLQVLCPLLELKLPEVAALESGEDMDLRLVPQLHFQSLDWSGFSSLATGASGALVYCAVLQRSVLSPGPYLGSI